MRRKLTVRIGAIPVALVLTLVGCGGGGDDDQAASSTAGIATSTPSSGATGTAASEAEAQITQNWELFFKGSTPAQQKIDLLQNGDQFAQLIQQQAQLPLARQTVAQVSKVTVTGPDTAQVGYDILLGTTPALQDQTGQAVLVDRVWKVGDQSFCSLLALEGAVPPMCPAASSATPPRREGIQRGLGSAVRRGSR